MILTNGKIISLFNIFIILTFVKSEKLPATINACSGKDPDVQNCILREAQKYLQSFCDGVPELDIPTMDPMYIDHMSMDNAGLQLEITNGSLIGTKTAKFSEFSINLVKNQGVIAQLSDLKLTGKYKLGGRILILPVQGDGDCLLSFKKLFTKVKYNLSIVKGADGKEHLKIGTFNLHFEVRDYAHFDFKNLFNGNKRLADTTLQFVNENWKIIMKEIAPPAMNKITIKYIEFMQKFFDQVPLEELLTS